ncbi:MAG: peptide-methionine (S)-S-oxide reductase MsrA [Rhodospirillaceae bacterium]
MAEATFAAGCFWGIEEAFRQVPGVEDTAVGYIGGVTKNPTYKQVCMGDTMHAEAVRVVYDPDAVSYEALLELFWKIHDPTQLNRQGPDVGTQYRSAIFTHDEDQAEAAAASKKAQQESNRFPGRIVTEIEDAPEFWRAEEYHQQYVQKEKQRGPRWW